MKKVVSFLVVLTFLVVASSYVFAQKISTYTAFATFPAETLSFDVTLHLWTGEGEYGTHASTDSIRFNASDVAVGEKGTSVSISSAYAKISSNINKLPSNVFVYVYTDNRANAAPYTASYAKVDGSTQTFDGLVKAEQTAAAEYAPLQTKCIKISSANTNLSGGPRTATFNDDEMFAGDRWMADSGNIYDDTPWAITGEDIKAVIGKGGVGGGIWVGYGTDAGGTGNWYSTEDVIMLFRAKFTDVEGGDSYGTTNIKFVIPTE